MTDTLQLQKVRHFRHYKLLLININNSLQDCNDICSKVNLTGQEENIIK